MFIKENLTHKTRILCLKQESYDENMFVNVKQELYRYNKNLVEKTGILGRNQDFYECDENTFVITNKNSTDKTRILYIKQELDSDNKNPLPKSGF